MKSGRVSFIGRPNAGKSTLLDTIVGEKVAIVSDKPQTTRSRILIQARNASRGYRTWSSGGQVRATRAEKERHQDAIEMPHRTSLADE